MAKTAENPIARYRAVNHKTLAEIGALIGCDAGQAHYYCLPLNDPLFRMPRRDQMDRITAALGIEPNQFYGHAPSASKKRGCGMSWAPKWMRDGWRAARESISDHFEPIDAPATHVPSLRYMKSQLRPVLSAVTPFRNTLVTIAEIRREADLEGFFLVPPQEESSVIEALRRPSVLPTEPKAPRKKKRAKAKRRRKKTSR